MSKTIAEKTKVFNNAMHDALLTKAQKDGLRGLLKDEVVKEGKK